MTHNYQRSTNNTEVSDTKEEDNILLLEKIQRTNFKYKQSLVTTLLRRKRHEGESMLDADGYFSVNNAFIRYYDDGRGLDRIMCDIAQIYPGDYRNLNTWSVRESLFSVREMAAARYLRRRNQLIQEKPGMTEVMRGINDSFINKAICPDIVTANYSIMKSYAELIQVRIDFYETISHEGYNEKYWEMDIRRLGSVTPDEEVDPRLTITILLVLREPSEWVEPVLVVKEGINAEYWESNVGCILKEEIRYAPLRRSFREISDHYLSANYKTLPIEWRLIDFKSEKSFFKGTYLEHLMELICEPQSMRDGQPHMLKMLDEEFIVETYKKRRKILQMLDGREQDQGVGSRFRWFDEPQYREVRNNIRDMHNVPFSTSDGCERWEANMQVLIECHSYLWRRRIHVYSRRDITRGHTKFALLDKFPLYDYDFSHRAVFHRWPVIQIVRNGDGSFSLLIHKDEYEWAKGEGRGWFGRVEPRAIQNRGLDISNYRMAERRLRNLIHARRWMVANAINADGGDMKKVITRIGLNQATKLTNNLLDTANFRIHHQRLDRIFSNRIDCWPFTDDGNDQDIGYDETHVPQHGEELLWKRNGEEGRKLGMLINEGGVYDWRLTLERSDEEVYGESNTLRLKERFVFIYAKKSKEIEDQNLQSGEHTYIQEHVWREDEILFNEEEDYKSERDHGERYEPSTHDAGIEQESGNDQSASSADSTRSTEDEGDEDYVEEEKSSGDENAESDLDDEDQYINQEDIDTTFEREVDGDDFHLPNKGSTTRRKVRGCLRDLKRELGGRVTVDVDKISIIFSLDGGNMTVAARTLFVKGLTTILGEDVGMMVTPFSSSSDGDIFSIKKKNSTSPDYLQCREVIIFHRPYTIAIKRSEAADFVQKLEELDVPCRVVDNVDSGLSYLSYLANLSMSWGVVVSALCKANVTCVHMARWGQKWMFGRKHLYTAERFCDKLEKIRRLTRGQTNFKFLICMLDIGITHYIENGGTYPQWTVEEEHQNLNYTKFPLWSVRKNNDDGGVNCQEKFGRFNENSPLDGIHENVKCYINSLHVILNYKKHGDTHCLNIREKTVEQIIASLELVEKLNEIIRDRAMNNKLGYRYEHSFKNKHGVEFPLHDAIKRACNARSNLFNETGIRYNDRHVAPNVDDVHQCVKCLLSIVRLYTNRRKNAKIKQIYDKDTIEMIQGCLCQLWTMVGYNNGQNSRKYIGWLIGNHGSMDPLGQQRAWTIIGGVEGKTMGDPELIDKIHREQGGYPRGMDDVMEMLEENRIYQINEQDDLERIELVQRLSQRSEWAQVKFQDMTTFSKLVFLRELTVLTKDVFVEAVKEHADSPEETQQRGQIESQERIDEYDEGADIMVAEVIVGEQQPRGQNCCCCSLHRKERLREECLSIKSTNPNLLIPCLNHEEFLCAQMPNEMHDGCFFTSLRCVRRPDESREKSSRLTHNDAVQGGYINSMQFWRALSTLLQSNEDMQRSDGGSNILGHLQSGTKVDAVWWPGDDQKKWPQYEGEYKPWFFDRQLIREVVAIVGIEEERENIATMTMLQIAELFASTCDCNREIIASDEVRDPGSERSLFCPIPITCYEDDTHLWEEFRTAMGEHLKRLGGWSQDQIAAIDLVGGANNRELVTIKKILGVKRKRKEGRSTKDLLTQIADKFRCGELSQETSTILNWRNENNLDDTNLIGDTEDMLDDEDNELQEQQEVGGE